MGSPMDGRGKCNHRGVNLLLYLAKSANFIRNALLACDYSHRVPRLGLAGGVKLVSIERRSKYLPATTHFTCRYYDHRIFKRLKSLSWIEDDNMLFHVQQFNDRRTVL